MTQNILFIGGGNMASSIIGGLSEKSWRADDIFVADPDQDKLRQLKVKYKINTTTDNTRFVTRAQIIVLAVKPQIVQTVVQQIATVLGDVKPLIISIAAGAKISSLQDELGADAMVVRVMPNTPALVRLGITGMYADKGLSQDMRDLAQNIMQSVGDVVWVENEDLINSITAVSGSGPAYFFFLFQAMEKAAIALNLEPQMARELIIRTAVGAARMASTQDLSFTRLKENVTSPGGTTERALEVFMHDGVEQTVIKAVKAAHARALEISRTE